MVRTVSDWGWSLDSGDGRVKQCTVLFPVFNPLQDTINPPQPSPFHEPYPSPALLYVSVPVSSPPPSPWSR